MLFGTSGTGGELPFGLAQERGYFRAEGVDVEAVNGLVGSRQIPAIGSGQLDLSGGSLSVSILNAINRGVQLKLVGSMGYYKNRNTSSTWLVRRADLADKFTKLQDVKNAKIGLIAPDSIPEYCVAGGFQKAGMDWKQVLDTQVLNFPSMVTALANKELDLAILGEPFVTQAEAKGIAQRWLSAPEMVGRPIQWIVLIAGPGLYQKPNLAVRWFKAYIRGLRDYEAAFVTKSNAAMHKLAIDVLDRMTHNPDPALYEKTTFWLPGPDSPADAILDEASLRDQLAYWKARGVATPAYEQLVDPTFAKEAAKQLG